MQAPRRAEIYRRRGAIGEPRAGGGRTAIATYRCPSCGRIWNADRPLWRCECGSHLNLTQGAGLARGEIAAEEASLWRYAVALALRGPPHISLGEGWTPLVRRDWAGAGVFFKLESQMPTGSFKDRRP